jgi:hypothetical protein
MRLLQPIIANILLFASAIGFGNLIPTLSPKIYSRIDSVSVTLLGGLGILGTLLFIVGQSWFSLIPILIIVVVGILLSVRPILSALRQARHIIGEMQVPLLPLAILGTVLVVTALAGLALPTGDMNNDSIAYHYLGPSVWLKQGVIRAVPDETLTYFPAVIETQYGALMALGSQRAPQLFSVISLLAILLAAASLATRMGLDQRGIWWSLTLLATMPALYRGLYGGFVDTLFAAFVLLAARLLFDAERPTEFAVCGIFCGLAMGTKYTGIMAFGLLAISLIAIAVWTKDRPTSLIFKGLVLTGFAAIVVASPFYLRNWLLYGCPIYPPPPALLRFFSPPGLSPDVMRELLKNVRETGEGMGKTPMNFLLLPFNLTYHTADFRGGGGIGLVPFVLGPFGLFALRRETFARKMALFAALQTVGWFATAQVSRYLIPVYVIGLIFGIIGWRYIQKSASRYGKSLAALAVAISILYGLEIILPDRSKDMHAALSPKFEELRRHAEIPYIASFDYINNEPFVQKVVILYPHVPGYFIEKHYIKPFGRWGEQTIPGASNVAQVMAQLPSLNATHVLDVKPSGGWFSLPDNNPGLTLVFSNHDQRIYRIN